MWMCIVLSSIFFFFQAEDGIRDADVTGVQTCALPICAGWPGGPAVRAPGPPHRRPRGGLRPAHRPAAAIALCPLSMSAASRVLDRKSTRLNSSHVRISYAVFCLKKKITVLEQLSGHIIQGL